MDPEHIIKAIEHQRNMFMTQNIELAAQNLALQKKIAELEKALADKQA